MLLGLRSVTVLWRCFGLEESWRCDAWSRPMSGWISSRDKVSRTTGLWLSGQTTEAPTGKSMAAPSRPSHIKQVPFARALCNNNLGDENVPHRMRDRCRCHHVPVIAMRELLPFVFCSVYSNFSTTIAFSLLAFCSDKGETDIKR